jgi:hypothetical protein
MELAFNVEASRTQKNCSAEAVGTDWQRGNVIDCRLQQCGVVRTGGLHRNYGRYSRQGTTAALKTREGEVDPDRIRNRLGCHGKGCQAGSQQDYSSRKSRHDRFTQPLHIS